MPRNRPKGQAPAATPPTPDAVSRATVQPPRAATGLPYGEHKALMDAQSSQPVADNAGRMQMAIQQAMAGQQAPLGSGAAMMDPTNAPLEPVTQGLPIGAGAGPEAIQAPAVPTSPDDFGMAHYLPMMEALADRPEASNAVRSYVRRIRGTIPPNITMGSTVRPGPQ